MEALYANVTISMSEFKKNPAAVLREAKNRPVAGAGSFGLTTVG